MNFLMEKKTIDILEKYNQTHLLNYINLLSQEETKNLEEQISKIDFEELKKLYKTTKEKPEIQENKIEHINYVDKQKLDINKKQELENIGKQIIANKQYAVITMAGGQGTRLGHKRTKRNIYAKHKKWTKIYF